MKDLFFQKKGENVHNFHPRPPCIIVPIATGARGKATRRARVFAVGADVCGNYAVLFVCI